MIIVWAIRMIARYLKTTRQPQWSLRCDWPSTTIHIGARTQDPSNQAHFLITRPSNVARVIVVCVNCARGFFILPCLAVRAHQTALLLLTPTSYQDHYCSQRLSVTFYLPTTAYMLLRYKESDANIFWTLAHWRCKL